jgi:hypothetical protein
MSLKSEVGRAWDEVLSPIFGEFSAEVALETLDEAATERDPVYGEAAPPKVYRPPVSVKARVKLARERVVLPGGESQEIDGRAVFRTDELAAQGLRLDFGARVTFQGEAFTVTRIEEAAAVGERRLLTKVELVREG